MNKKIILTIVALIAVQNLSTLGCFAQEDDQNESEPNGETGISLDLPSIFPIVGMIKSQIKEIVIDLAMQVFRFLRAIAQDIKVRLLKRLGKYTLSDCFHLMFDGVVEFVNEESYETHDTDINTETTAKMAEPEKTATEMATTEKTTKEIATTEKTSTTTTKTEASDENEDYSRSGRRSIYYDNPYNLWYYQ